MTKILSPYAIATEGSKVRFDTAQVDLESSKSTQLMVQIPNK